MRENQGGKDKKGNRSVGFYIIALGKQQLFLFIKIYVCY